MCKAVSYEEQYKRQIKHLINPRNAAFQEIADIESMVISNAIETAIQLSAEELTTIYNSIQQDNEISSTAFYRLRKMMVGNTNVISVGEWENYLDHIESHTV